MDKQQPTKSIGESIKNTVENARDAASEQLHKSAADAQRTRRDVEGDAMTPGEKLTSVASEAKHRVEAAGDHLKREVRERT
jgi:uncharacterized protein YjbJ (UPF0337 family)